MDHEMSGFRVRSFTIPSQLEVGDMTGRQAVVVLSGRIIPVTRITRAAAIAVVVIALPAHGQSRPTRPSAGQPAERVSAGSLVMRADVAGLTPDSVSAFDPGAFKALR